MKQWINRILGKTPDPAPNTDLNALDDYVVVKRKELEALVAEVQELRSRNVSTDARELDLMVGNLESENKALKALVASYQIQLEQHTMK